MVANELYDRILNSARDAFGNNYGYDEKTQKSIIVSGSTLPRFFIDSNIDRKKVDILMLRHSERISEISLENVYGRVAVTREYYKESLNAIESMFSKISSENDIDTKKKCFRDLCSVYSFLLKFESCFGFRLKGGKENHD